MSRRSSDSQPSRRRTRSQSLIERQQLNDIEEGEAGQEGAPQNISQVINNQTQEQTTSQNIHQQQEDDHLHNAENFPPPNSTQDGDPPMMSPSFQSPDNLDFNRLNLNSQLGMRASMEGGHRVSFVPMSYDRNAGQRYSSMFTTRGDLPGQRIGRRSSIGFRNIHDTIQEEEDAEEEAEDMIWGTHVTPKSVERRFGNFLTCFGQADDAAVTAGDYKNGKYMKVLHELLSNQELSLCIDSHDVFEFDRTLYEWLIQFPREVIPLCDPIVREAAEEICEAQNLEIETAEPDEAIHVKFYNLKQIKVIRDMDPADIDTLISIKGMVTRTSSISPDLRWGMFTCERCGEELLVECIQGALEEPEKCEQCGSKFSQRLIHNHSKFGNRQLVKMQESPEAIPEGETPHSVSMYVYDDLVDTAKPGDRVTVTGIYRANPIRENPRSRRLKSIYKNYIDIIHIDNDEEKSLTQNKEEQELVYDEFEIQQSQSQSYYNVNDYIRRQMNTVEDEMYGYAQMPDLYEQLVNSLAPSIWGLEDVKRGILCQLFGGTARKHASGQVRGEINILLVGDPGVSKSQLLSHVHKIAPRGIYVSGQGSSAVGLTAYIARDPDSREYVLEPGALILSDKGICCIDEFDKMNDSARSMLHEVMEQQTVSVAKAGIISVLRARTSILAAANPIGSKYNQRLSVKENINLPPTLMSRFDLIYLLLDSYNQENDRRLAQHILALMGSKETEQEVSQAPISREKLREYISFAKARVHPKLTEETAEYLALEYVEMRKRGLSRKAITATPRQLESLIRLSEALARMKLREDVQREDCAEAVRLMTVSLMQSATDPETGMIDLGIIQTGKTETERQMERQLPAMIQNIVQEKGAAMKLVDLHERLKQDSTVPIPMTTLIDILRGMEQVNYHASNGLVIPYNMGDE